MRWREVTCLGVGVGVQGDTPTLTRVCQQPGAWRSSYHTWSRELWGREVHECCEVSLWD